MSNPFDEMLTLSELRERDNYPLELKEGHYRRGYMQGMAFALYYLEHGMKISEVEEFMLNEILSWRESNLDKFIFAPHPKQMKKGKG